MLGAELGRGPAGVVYRAESAADPGRAAAVKLFTHPAALAPGVGAKFPADFLGLKRLGHPNIVAYYDAGVHDGRPWFAAELVAGTDAGALVKARVKKPGEPGLAWADDVLRIAVQVARALKHGHHRSLLHRSLKPSNLLVTPDGVVKVTDYGMAKLVPIPVADLPVDPWGTAGFLAPEQFTGKPLTRKSDLYALGGVLYALVTGRPPFPAASIAEFVHKHCYTLPDRPASFAPDMPADLDDLICLLLAKDPNRRPASPAAVIDELEQIKAKVERKGHRIAWPADPGDGSGPLPALTDAAESWTDSPSRDRPLMARPLVVLPLFALLVAVAATLYFSPKPTADELYAAAQPLVASADPADWDRAAEYLDPLSTRFPDAYPAEVAAARITLQDKRQLRRALGDAAKARPGSPAEFAYLRGLKLAEAGDTAGARREWERVGKVFGPVGAERRWVALAAEALAATADTHAGDRHYDTIAAALAAHAGTPAAAEVRALLEELYRDDPAGLAVIRATP